MPLYEKCRVCGAKSSRVAFEGGAVYSYACTAEIVVYRDKAVTINKCPDLDKNAEPS